MEAAHLKGVCVGRDQQHAAVAVGDGLVSALRVDDVDILMQHLNTCAAGIKIRYRRDVAGAGYGVHQNTSSGSNANLQAVDSSYLATARRTHPEARNANAAFGVPRRSTVLTGPLHHLLRCRSAQRREGLLIVHVEGRRGVRQGELRRLRPFVARPGAPASHG